MKQPLHQTPEMASGPVPPQSGWMPKSCHLLSEGMGSSNLIADALFDQGFQTGFCVKTKQTTGGTQNEERVALVLRAGTGLCVL